MIPFFNILIADFTFTVGLQERKGLEEEKWY